MLKTCCSGRPIKEETPTSCYTISLVPADLTFLTFHPPKLLAPAHHFNFKCMKKLYSIILLVSSVLCAARLPAQSTAYTYDKEKIYIQTDHVFFAPGQTMYFKIYLVKGTDNRPSRLSNIVYTEILGPSGTVQEKQTYSAENGYSEGSYTLDKQAAGGIYKIKAYTSWMRNEKDSSLFTKPFTVQNIIAPRILLKLDFDRKGYGAGADVIANFSMRNLDDAPIKHHSGEFTVSLDGHAEKKVPLQRMPTAKPTCHLPCRKACIQQTGY